MPIILAGSAAILSISYAISQVLSAIYKKPFLIEIYENEEIRDKNGNIIIGKGGKPQLKAIKKYKLLEPQKGNSVKNLEFGFDLKNGLLIKVKSEEKAANTVPKKRKS